MGIFLNNCDDNALLQEVKRRKLGVITVNDIPDIVEYMKDRARRADDEWLMFEVSELKKYLEEKIKNQTHLHWIRTGDGYAENTEGEMVIVYDTHECPCCGYKQYEEDPDLYFKFCPECGEDLREDLE